VNQVVHCREWDLHALAPLTAPAPALLACLALAGCARSAPPPVPVASAAPPAIAYEAHVAAGGIAPAGGVLTNPHAGDAAAARAGAQLFAAMNCDGCHNTGGSGWVGPNLADGRWRYGGADAEVFSSIFYGRPKGMPAFGGVLGADGVWTLVTYIRSLPVPSDLPTESWEQP
jgi:cytochrome c oxidase cbb3-type subunit 3